MPNSAYNRQYQCRPSSRHAAFVWVMAGLAVISIWTLPWWTLFKLLIVLCIAIYAYVLSQGEVGLQKASSILALQRHARGVWRVTTPLGVMNGKLVKTTLVTRFISVLQFRVEGRSSLLTCVLFPDSFDNDDYRRFVASF